MAVSRMLSQSRFALSRGLTAQRATGPILRVVSTAFSRQQFSSSVRAQEEVIQTPATGAEVSQTATLPSASGSHARSIGIAKMHWRTVPADVQQLLRNIGVEVKRMQFRIDRFTFECDTSAFVELASEEDAQKTIKALNGRTYEGRTWQVQPLSEKSYWDAGFKKEHRMFFYDADTPSQAIQGLLDGRRYRLYVENPGWVTRGNNTGKSANELRRAVIEKHIYPFGVETIGMLNPIWKQNKKSDSTFLTFIEFSSKENAERAVMELDGQVVEGKRMWLKPSTVMPQRAEQIGKVDKSLLAKLQQHGALFEKTEPSSKTEA